MIENILNFFYKFILILFRIINVNIHLIFRLYNIFFDQFNDIETQIRVNMCSFSSIIIKTCEQNFKKFAKYYFKIENKNDLIYNLINVLNFNIKLNLYKLWNQNENTNNDDNNNLYRNKYKQNFLQYFQKYYENFNFVFLIKTRKIFDVDEIMQQSNAFNI